MMTEFDRGPAWAACLALSGRLLPKTARSGLRHGRMQHGYHLLRRYAFDMNTIDEMISIRAKSRVWAGGEVNQLLTRRQTGLNQPQILFKSRPLPLQ